MEQAAAYYVESEQTTEPVVETYSGWLVDLNKPDPEVINITDIATSLSRCSRYNGHSKTVWSVASHSLLCVDFARQFFSSDATDWMCMHILLHDAHEAYTGDIVSPLKHMPEIRHHIEAIENGLQYAIETAFKIGHPAESERMFIKMIDEYVLAIEAHHLMHSKGRDWTRRMVFKDALDLFDEAGSFEHVCRHFIYRFDKLLSSIEFDKRTGVSLV